MKTIAITGATGGIGQALALTYAGSGVRLYLTGRKKEVLEALKRQCELLGAEVILTVMDLRDEDARTSWVKKLAKEADLSVVIFCAGVSSSVEKVGEVWLPERTEDLLREMQINAISPLLGANELVRERLGRGNFSPFHIVMISSLAAMTGLPCSAGYSASKVAVRVFAQSLRRFLAPYNIRVSVVLPGYVDSSMSRRYIGQKPWMISAALAATKIKKGVEQNRAEIIFPSILAWGIRLLEMLPEWCQSFFLKSFFFTVVPDEEAQMKRQKSFKED